MVQVNGCDQPSTTPLFRAGYTNLCGLPATAVPLGLCDAGLPIGVQVAARSSTIRCACALRAGSRPSTAPSCRRQWRWRVEARCSRRCIAGRVRRGRAGARCESAFDRTGAGSICVNGCGRRTAAACEKPLSFPVQRIATGGTRQWLMLRRSALRSDYTAALALAGARAFARHGTVRRDCSVSGLTASRQGRAAQLATRLRAALEQLRQVRSRSALTRADTGTALLAAARIASAGYRPPRVRGMGCWGPNTTGVAAKPVQGRPRCACAAPRSAVTLAARAARFNNILGASVRAQRASA